MAQFYVVLGLLDYRLCGTDEKQALLAVARRSAMLSTQPKFILRELLKYLSTQRIVAPGNTVLQDLVSRAVTDERSRVTRLLNCSLWSGYGRTYTSKVASMLGAQSRFLRLVRNDNTVLRASILARQWSKIRLSLSLPLVSCPLFSAIRLFDPYAIPAHWIHSHF